MDLMIGILNKWITCSVMLRSDLDLEFCNYVHI